MSGMVMRAVGLIVTAGLALTACTGSPSEPDVSSPAPTGVPTPAASASPSPSSPVKPVRPEAMKRTDAEGAAAAAEYFIELYPYVMATGDTEEFEAMSHRACGFCSDALEQAKRIKEHGYTYAGGDATLEVTETYVRDDVTGIYPLDTEISQKSSQISDSNGKEVHSTVDKISESRVEMGIRGGSWVVVTVAPIPVGQQ
ncbi:DUF6318 family protein [Promicromonospora sp. NPDC090134]|uniref:DUF6318 family protein n=1 Tax=Promicromonospora sp. NPDC090134 TaxID=3364408 RepID=UPI00382B2EF5